jgi:hypothetical protein
MLNSGGWQTPTTKERFNRFTPVSIWQHQHVWYLTPGPVPFFDGIIVDLSGKPLNADEKTIESVTQEEHWLRKAINRMISQLKRMPELPEPNNGDCFGCRFTSDNREYVMGSDCVLQHLRETYLHGSLVLRALRWAGYTDFAISLYWRQWSKDDKWARESVCRAMRRFLRSEARKTLVAEKEIGHGV